MKVLFLEDVPPATRSGDIKEVAPGYARNYLMPRNLAVPATPAAIKGAELLRQARLKQKARTEAEFRELAAQLEGKAIRIQARVGARDQLYGSITRGDVAARLQEQLGITLDKRKIGLDKPLRKLGDYEIPIKLSLEIGARLKVSVEEEKSEGERGEAAAS
ncbi:MAG: 50S ribosomal protein L9 [Chloroflexi bacterium]|nr:50S ribosomal protein L9 [Chloroflexota bacterium]